MAKRRMGIIGLLLWFCLCLVPCRAQAASTSDAVEPILTAQDCTLTISYVYDGTALSGTGVKLYKIADVSADFRYTLVGSFLSSGLTLNGVRTDGEWNTIRSTAESFLLANHVAETAAAVTNGSGQASFSTLKAGLYLAVPAAQSSLPCTFDSALIALPGLKNDGRWEYQLSVVSKSEALPPPVPTPPPPVPEPENEKQLKVLKLWKGDEGKENRPASVEVEIFKDGASYQAVVLSEENNWSFSWTVKEDGADWMVAECNVPVGYTVTVAERGDAFVLTNTWVSEEPPAEDPTKDPTKDPSGKPSEKPPSDEELDSDGIPKGDMTADVPETGDTPHIMLFTVLMYVSGMLLVILGVTGKRSEHEE